MWQVPCYSKKQIEAAGRDIACAELEVGRRLEATKIIDNWRAAHAYPMHQIAASLKQAIDNPEIIQVQRLKRLDSIIAKLSRYPEMSLARMQDLGGCRVIVQDVAQVYDTVEKIRALVPFPVMKCTDYMQSPKPSGYRGIHLIFRYEEANSPYNKMLIEVQVRTGLQHMWATAVETLGEFTNDHLKASMGSACVLRFLTLVSSLFALEEGTPAIPQTEADRKVLLCELRKCDQEEHIFHRLQAIQTAVESSKKEYSHQEGYYILAFDYRSHSVEITHYPQTELKSATEKYEAIELQNDLDQKTVDAVLVSAARFHLLREAYPNYFSDVKAFTRKVEGFLREAEKIKGSTSGPRTPGAGNFAFLAGKTEYSMFSLAAAEAEKIYHSSPAMCAVGCRKALELAVKWVYAADNTMQLPYKDNLQSLINEPSFRFALDASTWGKLPYIIKLGNLAVHTERGISAEDALASLKGLYEFIQWVDYCYGSSYEERSFDAALIPREKIAVDTRQIKEQESLLVQKDAQIEALRKQIREMSAQFTAQKQHADSRVFTPGDTSEFATRKRYIDVDMKAMGWKFDGEDADVWEEYEVDGMGGVLGQKGRADYVLIGKDKLPLAVVEAKRVGKDPNIGRKQAAMYADCLEQKFGRRPMMFTTNGFETYFWDDLSGPQRKVSGIFSKDDLQKLMNRRSERQDLLSVPIDDKITDRYYQKEAIRAVCEQLTKGVRRHLLVMATGTGKTRTASSLTDVLSRGGAVTNILFLADRTALVKQAKDDFKNYLPDMSLCNLCTNKDDRNARIVFSTYPTILNAIDDVKSKDGLRLFTPAHFDLIIIDESHRSIFKKYRAIFEYFDAVMVGLTATPKTDVDRNTYDFFEMEHGVPTYAYDYETAVYEDHVLVPYYNYEVKTKFLEEGITYNDLSEEDKRRYEDAFIEDGAMPEFIPSAQLNKFVFNETTVDTVLQDLMDRGIKVAGGDRLGKTIIFAQNKRHAEFILERFNKLYPMEGAFAQRVICDDTRAQKVIDDFKQPEKEPHIAVSVDMMDTGIDAPHCVNLVFFKKVRSKAKFWQMIGRGTRLCKGLTCTDQIDGEYTDKRRFLIFDYCGNFEYFREHKEGYETRENKSLSENIFGKRIKLISLLQEGAFAEDSFQAWRSELAAICHGQVAALNQELVEVRLRQQYVEKYRNIAAFTCLGEGDKRELLQHIAPVVSMEDTDEYAKRFDNFMYGLILADLEQMPTLRHARKQLKDTALLLERKGGIPQIRPKLPLIREIGTDAFWEANDILALENVRKELRDLIQFIVDTGNGEPIRVILADPVIASSEGEMLDPAYDFEDYRDKVNRYINENSNTLAIYKLTHNIPLGVGDYSELERVLTSKLGSREDYVREFGDTPFGLLVRRIAKLDHDAAMQAFSEFINDESLNQKQIAFVHKVISFVEQNGYMENVTDLRKPPFDKPISFMHLFNTQNQARLIAAINAVKDNAVNVIA